MAIRKRASKLKAQAHKKLQGVLIYPRIFFMYLSLLFIKIKGVFTNNNIVIIALYEHIGDIISCEPVIAYAKQQNTNTKVFWAVKKDYAELLECHAGITGIIKLKFFYDWILLRKLLLAGGIGQSAVIDLHINEKPCPVFKKKLYKKNASLNFNNHLNGRSQLEAFSIAASLPVINKQPVFYINQSKALTLHTAPYIVFHTQSNMKMKDWNIDDWNSLCNFCIQAGYYVVEVGINKMVEVSNEKYINLTGKTSLQRIASIINCSAFFIGIDSGFAHMANALQKNGLVLIGQYKIDKTVFNRYNPFTGMYSSPDYIVYADDNIVSTISCSKVINRLSHKLNLTPVYGQ